MSDQVLLTIDGEVEAPRQLTFQDFAAIDSAGQIVDVSQIDPKRSGDAVKLTALLDLVRAKPNATWITLHASLDDFHASIPLDAVRDRAIVIYRLNGAPLPQKAGGPVRFFIPDFAACHTSEIDECANVKFVDRIEFATSKGFDNRPHDGASHEELHRQQGGH
jgi:DMSO/TMAO reductase YedYZ molybdopterin-dependent catalytic subunit